MSVPSPSALYPSALYLSALLPSVLCPSVLYLSALYPSALSVCSQVEREKLLNEERVCRQESENSNLGTSLRRIEEENIDLQRQTQNLQAQLAEVESQHAQRWVSPSTVHQ